MLTMKPASDALPMFEQQTQQIPQTELLAVLMPTRDGQMSMETHLALSSNSGPLPMLNIIEARRPVVDARNSLAQKVLEAKREGQYTLNYALWVDSDAWWPAGTLARMLSIMQQRFDIDMLTGYSCDRMPFCSGPWVMRAGVPVAILPHATRAGDSVPHPRFNAGDVVEIDAAPFHFVLMRTSLLERVGPSPFNVPENAMYGEDMQFCFRAKTAGAKIACDTGSIVAHVDVDNGLAFIPHHRPGRIDGNRFGIVVDPRTDEEIQEEWKLKNIRANRRYGGTVDKILQRTYQAYVAAKTATA